MLDLSAFVPATDAMQKQIGTAVATLLWAGAGVALTQLWNIFKQWRAARQQAKQSHPVYLADKQIKLDIAADRVCQWAGADHVSIHQFSNGHFFSNGDSIQKISMVGEATESNLVGRWRLDSQNLPTSAFPYLMRGVQAGRMWVYRDACEDYELDQLLRKRGYATCLCVLLQGHKGAWLGLLTISWGLGHFTDEHLNLTTLDEHRRACAFILAEK